MPTSATAAEQRGDARCRRGRRRGAGSGVAAAPPGSGAERRSAGGSRPSRAASISSTGSVGTGTRAARGFGLGGSALGRTRELRPPRGRAGRAPDVVLEERLQYRAEVLPALDAELVGEPVDRSRPPPRDLGPVDVVHASEVVVGHAPPQREREQLSIPRVQAVEGGGELFGTDHRGRRRASDKRNEALGLLPALSRASSRSPPRAAPPRPRWSRPARRCGRGGSPRPREAPQARSPAATGSSG